MTTIDRVISLSSESAVEPVVVQQNDRESRKVRFFVTVHGGAAYDVTGKQAKMFFRKNGATSKGYEAEIQSDGWISLVIPEEATQYAGTGEMQVVIYDGGGFILHGFKVAFVVRASLSYIGEEEVPEEEPKPELKWENIQGKPDRFPPSDHKHNPADAGALPADGTAKDSSKLAGKAPEHYLQPYNLFDNSDFKINQRGKTTYTGGGQYTLDRWKTVGDSTVNVVANGITFTPNVESGFAYFDQCIEYEKLKIGTTYTMAIHVDGEIGCGSFTYNGETSGSVVLYRNESANLQMAIYYLRSYAACRIRSAAVGTTYTFNWTALYEGEYTAETLPPYVPKDYAAELVKCRLYYRPVNQFFAYCYANGYCMGFSFEPMRIIKPTLNILVKNKVNVDVGGDTTCTFSSTGDILHIDNPNFVSGEHYRLLVESNADL